MDNKVSIIIPVYNAEMYLDECIQSAQIQSYPNKELIIIDDGSSDNSYMLAEKYRGHQVIVQKQDNKGSSAARNHGLRFASGDYIQFLDADDILHQDKIKVQVADLDGNKDKVAVGCTYRFFNEPVVDDSKAVDEWCLKSTENTADFFINMWGAYGSKIGMVQPNSWLIPRTLIESSGTWNESLSLDDDGEFFARIVLNSGGIIYCPDAINFYRKSVNSDNLAAQHNTTHMQSALLSLDLKAKHLFDKDKSDSAKKAIARLYMLLAVNSYLCHREISEESEKKAYKYSNKPTFPRLGGRMLEFVKSIFGWKAALRLKAKIAYKS